jgi:multidrug transporter EmrE-like cation transporter
MAGFETSLLLVLGFVAFSEKMTFQKLIGIMMVLAGIYVIG